MDIKLIVAGGRDFNDEPLMMQHMYDLCVTGIYKDADVSLVCGMARGADMLAHKIFTQAGAVIHAAHANWDKYGKSAGYRRNEDMGRIADAALIFWDGQSKGTKHMIDIMKRLNKPVHLVMYGK